MLFFAQTSTQIHAIQLISRSKKNAKKEALRRLTLPTYHMLFLSVPDGHSTKTVAFFDGAKWTRATELAL